MTILMSLTSAARTEERGGGGAATRTKVRRASQGGGASASTQAAGGWLAGLTELTEGLRLLAGCWLAQSHCAGERLRCPPAGWH